MRLLLDTAPLYWWLIGRERLPRSVGTLIANPDNEVLASAVSFYELNYKTRLGKLESFAGGGGIPYLDAALQSAAIQTLAISSDHAAYAGRLDWNHRDPWDRIIAAQARLESCALISSDAAFDTAGVERIW